MGPFGSDIKVENFVSEGVPVLNGSNLDGFKLSENKFKYVTKEKAKTFKKAIASRGDIVITHRGTLGQMSFIPENSKHAAYVISQSQFRVRLKTIRALPSFFVYYFHTPEGQRRLLAYKNHVGVPALAQATTNFRQIEIPLPILDVQKKIAKILLSLDDKIHLNNRINTELEAMAKTLYDYWFVQFNFPDAKGKPYKTSGGKMVWNEVLKREIPKGWEVKSLLDIADFTNGLACQKFRPTIGGAALKVIKIRDMKDGFSSEPEWVRADIPSKVVINNGDVLFSWSASLEVILWSGGIGALNQHIFIVTSSTYPKSFFYFQVLNYLQHFKMMAEIRKTTMGHITQEHLQQSKVAVPPVALTMQLDKLISPILNKQIASQVENHSLAALRDWLLPMLMNGQVRVRWADSSTKCTDR